MSPTPSETPSANTAPEAPDAFLSRLQKLNAAERLIAVNRALETLSSKPAATTVFLRKALLRMQDATRLETGAVTQGELQRENSPFTKKDFRRARLTFRPRVSA